jgi:hypothetical protein
MITAQEIEDAIRSLAPSERDKLLDHIPHLFREFAGDSEWQRLIHDERPRAGLTTMLNQHEAHLNTNAGAFPPIAESDFEAEK